LKYSFYLLVSVLLVILLYSCISFNNLFENNNNNSIGINQIHLQNSYAVEEDGDDDDDGSQDNENSNVNVNNKDKRILIL
jgi:hypothetical protein